MVEKTKINVSHHKLELEKLLAFTLHNFAIAQVKVPLQIDMYKNQYHKDYLFEIFFSGAALRVMGRTDSLIGLNFNIYSEYHFGENHVSQLIFNNDRGVIHAHNHRDMIPYFAPIAALGYCLKPAPRFSQKWDLEKLMMPVKTMLDNRDLIIDNSFEPMDIVWLEQDTPLRRRYCLTASSRYGKALSSRDQVLVLEPNPA